MEDCEIPYYVNCGDFISGFPFCEKEDVLEEIREFRENFKALEEKCLIVEGNHDRWYSPFSQKTGYSKKLSKAELVQSVYPSKTIYSNRVFGEDDTYFYQDDLTQKTRFIVLNTHDVPNDVDSAGNPIDTAFEHFVLRQKQLEWFAHKALVLPNEEWAVVLCTHENATVEKRKHLTQAHEAIVGVINAFTSGGKFDIKLPSNVDSALDIDISVDYHGQRGNFTFWVAGHEHKDSIVVENGITSVCILNDSCGAVDRHPYPHFLGMITEHAFDVFIVDRRNRKATAVRIGCGENREFNF
jgi:hypothetical protein